MLLLTLRESFLSLSSDLLSSPYASFYAYASATLAVFFFFRHDTPPCCLRFRYDVYA